MTDRLTDEDLKEIRERAEKATDGPWQWEPVHPREPEEVLYQHVRAGATAVCETSHFEHFLAPTAEDEDAFIRGRKGKSEETHFIAHARTDIPRLLDEVERLRAELAPVDCPHCDGKGGSTDYYGEWCECMTCDEAGELTPTERAVAEADRASENHFYGILGPLEDKIRCLQDERDRYREALEEINDKSIALLGGVKFQKIAETALESDQ